MNKRHDGSSAAQLLVNSLSASEDGVRSSLDRMVLHCASEFECKIALVTALDDNDQHFLAKFGTDLEKTSREASFCQYALESGSPLNVTDASKDERLSEFASVVELPHIRSVLAVPIRVNEGEQIGTICLLHDESNHFLPDAIDVLSRYAKGVEDMLRLHDLHVKAEELGKIVEEQNKALAEKNRIYLQAEAAAQVGSWELIIDTGELNWSDGVYTIHELSAGESINVEEAIGFYDDADRDMVSKCVEQAVASRKPFEFDATIRTADGTIKRVRSHGKYLPACQTHPARLVGAIKDISDNYRAEVALRHAAEHDALTELYNRHAFDRMLRDRISQASDEEAYLCLLLIDLDGFKDVNDTLGHIAGDIVLEDTGRRILRAVPKGSVAARWGGDEFAVILPANHDRKLAEATGTAILEAICQRSDVSGQLVDIGATAGLVCETGRASAKELVRRADTALFFGKKREQGRVHFYSEKMERENFLRRKAIAQVRQAIHEDRLFPGYQPIVNLVSREPVGFEALMRLTTRDGSKLTATEVSPALLDPTLSREISGRMLQMVSNDIQAIKGCAPQIRFVSVNASEADLLSDGFVHRFTDQMVKAGVDCRDVVLEVTETILLVENSQPVKQVLEALKGLGVTIALDDFGTGYSSLSHLREFPLDKVKIDGSFVRTLTYEQQSRTIVQALIGMARSMDIEVVAEGIETEAQSEILVNMGCALGQGFLFGAAEDISRIALRRLVNVEPERKLTAA